MDPNAPIAFAAGLVAFSSPCCLPLLPGCLAFISDLSADIHESESRRRVFIGASLFVLGFSVVFTALGATASLLGSFLLDNRQLFFRVSGVFLVAMGLAMLVGAQIPFRSRMARSDLSRMRRGPVGAFPLGMAFAFGWTPCVGPVLAGLLTYAGATGSLIDGAGLLFVYSLGFGSALHRCGAALQTSSRVFHVAASLWRCDQPGGRRHLDRDGDPAFHRQLDGAIRPRPALVRTLWVATDLSVRSPGRSVGGT